MGRHGDTVKNLKTASPFPRVPASPRHRVSGCHRRLSLHLINTPDIKPESGKGFHDLAHV